MSGQSTSSAWVAELTGGLLRGPADLPLTGVAALDEAQAGDVSFLANPRYRDRVLPSRAGVVLVPEGFTEAPPAGRAWIECHDPSAAFTRVVEAFAPPPPTYAPGIHPTAVVAASARLAASAHVGPGAVVGERVAIGERSVVGALCFLGDDVRLGDDCLLYPHVSVRERCRLGQRVILHGGVVVGADGFGYTSGPQGHAKIPQVGIVQIDDDVEIGANSAVDRARFGRTWIQRGTKIDNLVQVAHNVIIGQHCLVVGQAGIAGSTRLGHGVVLAGQAGVGGHLVVGDGAIVMGQAAVTKDVPPKAAVMGTPAVDRLEFARAQMNLKRFDRLQDRLRELEAQVQELRHRLDGQG